MTIPEKAIEAAAAAAEHHSTIFQQGACADHYHEDSWESVAQNVLAAAAPFMLAGELRRIADEFKEIAADIGDSEPATERDQWHQFAAERAYLEASRRMTARADTIEEK